MSRDRNIDFGRQAADYARYRQGPDDAFFDRLSTLGVGLPGQRILDLGTGTGLFARALAQRGCVVTGIDPSEPLLKEAQRLDRQAGIQIEYRLGVAENTGFSPAEFDCVTASTCWHWFGRLKAGHEAHRVLKPGGKLAIAALDWMRMPGNVIDVTLEVMGQHQASVGATPRTFLYPDWTNDLVVAGFRQWEAFAYTTRLQYSHEAWCGRVRASADIAGLGTDKVAQFSEALTAQLHRQFPEEILQVDHSLFCLVAR